jgi:phosphate transport system protein
MSSTPASAGPDELRRLAGDINRMAGLVEAQVAGALEAVARRDVARARELIEKDAAIDAMQAEIERRAVALIATRTLGDGELRRAVSALKLAMNLERCGDLARNIAKRSLVLSANEPVLALVPPVDRMGRLVLARLTEVMDAHIARDVGRAVAVWRRDEEVDDHYEALFRDILALMAQDPGAVTAAAHLLFIAKNLERIGDHATNIAEIAHYEMTGEALAGDRPKPPPDPLELARP